MTPSSRILAILVGELSVSAVISWSQSPNFVEQQRDWIHSVARSKRRLAFSDETKGLPSGYIKF